MSIDSEPITLDWVSVGPSALGLLFAGRIVAVATWEDTDLAELDPAQARKQAANAYFEAQLERVTDELRSEAAELLGRSRWWREELLREDLLGRDWHRAR